VCVCLSVVGFVGVFVVEFGCWFVFVCVLLGWLWCVLFLCFVLCACVCVCVHVCVCFIAMGFCKPITPSECACVCWCVGRWVEE